MCLRPVHPQATLWLCTRAGGRRWPTVLLKSSESRAGAELEHAWPRSVSAHQALGSPGQPRAPSVASFCSHLPLARACSPCPFFLGCLSTSSSFLSLKHTPCFTKQRGLFIQFKSYFQGDTFSMTSLSALQCEMDGFHLWTPPEHSFIHACTVSFNSRSWIIQCPGTMSHELRRCRGEPSHVTLGYSTLSFRKSTQQRCCPYQKPSPLIFS